MDADYFGLSASIRVIRGNVFPDFGGICPALNF
jgi:hypothetical protein